MKLYTVRFSNGLYLIAPSFAHGDRSVDGTLTANINYARLLDNRETATRYAKNALECREQCYIDNILAGCSYEIIEVRVVEV